MEQKPERQDLPVVPLNAATLAANVAIATYLTGNGGFVVLLADQRMAPINQIGEKPKDAIFEIGRFFLTPRALRQLLDTASAAVQKYKDAVGRDLPTVDQFNASAAISTLLPGLQQGEGKPPES